MATADTRQSNSLYSQFEMETVSECEKTVTAILGEWQAMVQLFSLVARLQSYLLADAANPQLDACSSSTGRAASIRCLSPGSGQRPGLA